MSGEQAWGDDPVESIGRQALDLPPSEWPKRAKAKVTLKPSQVLDVQMDLLDKFGKGPGSPFAMMIAGTMADRIEAMPSSLVNLVNPLYSATLSGEAFYVTDDLAAEAERRARSTEYMRGTRAFDWNDAPTQTGVAYIEGGLNTRELRGRQEKGHLIVWGPSQVQYSNTGGPESVTLIAAFNDLNDPDPDETARSIPDEIQIGMRNKVGRWSLTNLWIVPKGQRMGPPFIVPGPEQEAKAREMDDRDRDLPNWLPYPEPGQAWWENGLRQIVALWDLFNESVNVVSHGNAHLDRPTVRRARRANLPSRVTVVKLRRAKYVDHEYLGATSVDWNHRWLVRRHKRWQPCGPGRTERKLIWIESHEKGPADKPLIQSTKVYRLDR